MLCQSNAWAAVAARGAAAHLSSVTSGLESTNRGNDHCVRQACVEGFTEVDAEIGRRAGGSGGGTTAVLALAVGWELLIAGVGDSLAVLDTGAQVKVVRQLLPVAGYVVSAASCLTHNESFLGICARGCSANNGGVQRKQVATEATLVHASQ